MHLLLTEIWTVILEMLLPDPGCGAIRIAADDHCALDLMEAVVGHRRSRHEHVVVNGVEVGLHVQVAFQAVGSENV